MTNMKALRILAAELRRYEDGPFEPPIDRDEALAAIEWAVKRLTALPKSIRCLRDRIEREVHDGSCREWLPAELTALLEGK